MPKPKPDRSKRRRAKALRKRRRRQRRGKRSTQFAVPLVRYALVLLALIGALGSYLAVLAFTTLGDGHLWP